MLYYANGTVGNDNGVQIYPPDWMEEAELTTINRSSLKTPETERGIEYGRERKYPEFSKETAWD